MTTMDFVAETTLAWCNEKRREKGQEPLEEMPKGVRDDPESCPCGRATGLYVDRQTYGEDKEHIDQYQLPDAVATFVTKFDEGWYPQYEEFPNEEGF